MQSYICCLEKRMNRLCNTAAAEALVQSAFERKQQNNLQTFK